MHQCQRFLICPLDWGIYPVTFPLFKAGPLWGFNWVNVSFEILHLTFSRYTTRAKSLLVSYKQICVQKGQKISIVVVFNAKFQNPNVKSMTNTKWLNWLKVRTTVSSAVDRGCSRQGGGICFVIEAFGFHLTFELWHLFISGLSGLGSIYASRVIGWVYIVLDITSIIS